MYTHGDTSSILLPLKFSLIFFQNILIYIIYTSKEDYIYGAPGQNFSETDKEFPRKSIVGGCWAIWLGCYFEFFVMIIGYSVHFAFAKFNLLQIVLHFIGCLFTMWFILDTWNYTRIWNIFIFNSLLPLILELLMIN